MSRGFTDREGSNVAGRAMTTAYNEKTAKEGAWQCTGCGAAMEVEDADTFDPTVQWRWITGEDHWAHLCVPVAPLCRAVRATERDLVAPDPWPRPSTPEPEAGARIVTPATLAELDAAAMRLASGIQDRLFALLAEWPDRDDELDAAGDACDLAKAYASLMSTVREAE